MKIQFNCIAVAMRRNQPSGSLNADLSSKLKRAVGSGDTTAVRRLLKGGVDCSGATFWVGRLRLPGIFHLSRRNSKVRYQLSLGAPLWNCAIWTSNSQICVALMVSAPIYVAQKQMSY